MLRHANRFIAIVILASAARAAIWPQLGGGPRHDSLSPVAPAPLQVLWNAPALSNERYVPFQTPVAYGGRVLAIARVFTGSQHTSNRLIAFHRDNGARLWTRPLPKDQLDSWSSPAIDTRNHQALVAIDNALIATQMADGLPAWTAPLNGDVVNCSPTTSDDLFAGSVPANRAFVTTYDPNGPGGELVAINLDPYYPVKNPFQPGEEAWRVPGLAFAGNTVAYADGLVVVSTSDGWVLALDAYDGSPEWKTHVGSRFFGAVSIHGNYAFAATYNFFGGQNNSTLVKIRLDDGAIIWTRACERSDSAPIVANGVIYLASGIRGFGSFIKVQAFEDLGASAVLLWDTYANTGGALRIGGWTTQPLYASGRLYVGAPPTSGGSFDPYGALYVLDTTSWPGNAGFILSSHNGSGGSPAVLDGRLFSIGANGLFAFAPTPLTESTLIHVEDVEVVGSN